MTIREQLVRLITNGATKNEIYTYFAKQDITTEECRTLLRERGIYFPVPPNPIRKLELKTLGNAD